MIMRCFDGIQGNYLFCYDPIMILNGAPYRIDHYISRKNEPDPGSVLLHGQVIDNANQQLFFSIWKFVCEYNWNMTATFTCYWISLLD